MKVAIIALGIAAAVAASPVACPLAWAQKADMGATTTTGDAAVSPASSSPSETGPHGTNRPTPAAGVNSGAMNNGTTGDTIGTGPGTTGSTPGLATTGSASTSR